MSSATSKICKVTCSGEQRQSESASVAKTVGKLETELEEQRLAATQLGSKVGHLEGALAAEQGKRKAETERCEELYRTLQARPMMATTLSISALPAV